MSFPEELKPFKRYLVQANQIQKVKPAVAYYCRLYALTLMLDSIKEMPSQTINEFAGGLVEKLEKDKKTISPPLDQERDSDMVRDLAVSVFDRADQQDRDGEASIQTSHAFMTAFVLLEVMDLFGGDTDPQVEQMKKYAKWKAADISKAIKEGRKPTPGGGADRGNQQQQVDAELEEKINGGNNIPSVPVEDDVPSYQDIAAPKKYPAPAAAPVSPSKKILPSKGLNPTDAAKMKRLKEVEVVIREAMAAIRFDDVGFAKAKIKDALKQLNQI
jgi:hypothetical protein